MKRVALLVVLLFGCVCVLEAFKSENIRTEFDLWMKEHSKSYSHREYNNRFLVFAENYKKIQQHNANPLKTFTMGMNKFGDLTHEEFKKYYLGGINPSLLTAEDRQRIEAEQEQSKLRRNEKPTGKPLPQNWDWSQNDTVVSYVKDQGQCGSCWAFSTTGSTEGCNGLKKDAMTTLSEQNLVDCSGSWGNTGCDGGLMTSAMLYIINNKGIDTEDSYPYYAQDETCAFSKTNVGATLTGMVNVTSGDEHDLQVKAYIAPVSVAIDASDPSFQFYDFGIYTSNQCQNDVNSLDHGVLVVGWGFDSGWFGNSSWWVVKNSWGDEWGMSGYIHMAKDMNNMCGIATLPTLPTC